MQSATMRRRVGGGSIVLRQRSRRRQCETGSVAETSKRPSNVSSIAAAAILLVVLHRSSHVARAEHPAPLPWSTTDSCASSGYDFCGVLEFCQVGTSSTYGYRLPCTLSSPDDGLPATDRGLMEDCPCRGGPGPLVRLSPGKKYRLTLSNAASSPYTTTNLHTHGLHLVGSGDGDDMTRRVGGGGNDDGTPNCLDYTWDVPPDHPGGTYWYHAHHHGSTEEQVGGGAFGMLVVEDDPSVHVDPLPEWSNNELLLQIAVEELCGEFLGNGNADETLTVEAMQWYRLRVSIVDPEGEAKKLKFEDGCEVHKVASDGVWRSEVPDPTAKNEHVLTGASRADFALRCSAPGSTVGIGYRYSPRVATIVVGETHPDPYALGSWKPTRPPMLSGMLDATVSPENKFNVSMSYDRLNSLEWDPSTPLKTIAYDEVHEWTIRSSDQHVFHLHLYHMQIATPGGCGPHHEEGEFYDTIASEEPCVVRFKTADFGQRLVFHCHVLMHGDNGSMGWVNVTGADMPRNDVVSLEYSCPAFTREPTKAPTMAPSEISTMGPSEMPTTGPSEMPTGAPTARPSGPPSSAPSDAPSTSPMKNIGSVGAGALNLPAASRATRASSIRVTSPLCFALWLLQVGAPFLLLN